MFPPLSPSGLPVNNPGYWPNPAFTPDTGMPTFVVDATAGLGGGFPNPSLTPWDPISGRFGGGGAGGTQVQGGPGYNIDAPYTGAPIIMRFPGEGEPTIRVGTDPATGLDIFYSLDTGELLYPPPGGETPTFTAEGTADMPQEPQAPQQQPPLGPSGLPLQPEYFPPAVFTPEQGMPTFTAEGVGVADIPAYPQPITGTPTQQPVPNIPSFPPPPQLPMGPSGLPLAPQYYPPATFTPDTGMPTFTANAVGNYPSPNIWTPTTTLTLQPQIPMPPQIPNPPLPQSPFPYPTPQVPPYPGQQPQQPQQPSMSGSGFGGGGGAGAGGRQANMLPFISALMSGPGAPLPGQNAPLVGANPVQSVFGPRPTMSMVPPLSYFLRGF